MLCRDEQSFEHHIQLARLYVRLGVNRKFVGAVRGQQVVVDRSGTKGRS